MDRDFVRELAMRTATELVYQGQTRRECTFDYTQIVELPRGDTVTVVITQNRQSIRPRIDICVDYANPIVLVPA